MGGVDGLSVSEDLTLCDLPYEVRGVEFSEAFLGHDEELPDQRGSAIDPLEALGGGGP